MVLDPREAAAEQHALASLIARHGVTHLQCTPSLARLLLSDAPARAGLAALQHLLVGGEALSDPLADELRAAVPKGRLHNMYGPTETTVWSTMHDVGADEHPVPIGRPLANTHVYVLDTRGELVPVGVPGELFIGGLGVTRGYLGQEELTASRFPADPFASAGARMYRTGDRVRWRADRTIGWALSRSVCARILMAPASWKTPGKRVSRWQVPIPGSAASLLRHGQWVR